MLPHDVGLHHTGDSVSPLWQGPATVFIALIAWSLYSNSEFRRQIEESGLLATIASHLRLLPLEAVQDMHEVQHNYRERNHAVIIILKPLLR